MPVPTAPTTAVSGQPARASLQFNALAAQMAWALTPPLAVLRQSVAQAALVSGTYTDVLMDTEDIDRDGAHSTVTNTNRFTAVTAGWYEVEATVSFAANATGIRVARLNVTTVGAVSTQYVLYNGPSNGATSTATYNGTQTVFLGVGDWVGLQARQDSTANLLLNISADATSRMTVRWVSS